MPPKSYTCVICNKEVSKRTSYAVKDGRACRSHEKAQSAHAGREEKYLDLSKAHAASRRFTNNSYLSIIRNSGRHHLQKEFEELMEDTTRCHICRKQGVHVDEFLMTIALANTIEEASICEMLLGKAEPILDIQIEMMPKVILPAELPAERKFTINPVLVKAIDQGVLDLIFTCGDCRKKYDLTIHHVIKEDLAEHLHSAINT